MTCHTPDLSLPDLSRPDFSLSGFSQPDLSQPDLSKPDFSPPDFSLARPTYLVLVTEALVAQDLALTVIEYEPSARVLTARTHPEAERAVLGITRIDVAFIAGNPAEFAGSTLHRSLVARGARIVLMGHEAERTGPSPVFDVLAQPFDTAAAIAKLQACRAHP